jgi:hypothetical protein
MNAIQILSAVAISVCVSLIAFPLTYEDSLLVQYEQCLNKYKQAENTTSEEFILEKYPQLQLALNCINKAKRLKFQVTSMAGNPAPNINSTQTKELKNKRQQIVELRLEAAELLERVGLEEKLVYAGV